ncbi:MAG: SRPBCC family protein [Acidimicrobiaceae bacterium]|nr:SRPBCC family protein [Acidimicrobiaceae bacterium]
MEQLLNEFSVALPIEKAWRILTDIEKIAPCLPGAALEEIDGETYSGSVKVKVGPIVASYKGKASFVEMDHGAHRAVLKAEGRDTKGQGNASATITAELSAEGDQTKVKVTTDLAITGRVAQFGRGVLSDVSSKLMGQFVASLEELIASDSKPAAKQEAPVQKKAEKPAEGGTNSSAVTPQPNDGPRKIAHKEAEPVDLLNIAGSSLKKRLIPGGFGALVFVIFLLGRRRRKNRRRANNS